MLQIQLPLFPPELTFVNNQVSFQKREGRIYYFHGLFPLFSHEEKDLHSFRFITSQLVVSGRVKEIEVARAFGVSYISVKRSVKRLREEGPKGFYKKAKARSSHVLTGEVLEKAQKLLDQGHKPVEVAKELDLKANTVRKAVQAGRLHVKAQDNQTPEEQRPQPQTKSKRAVLDSQAGMGIGCTRQDERVAAAFGELAKADPVFQENVDVKSAGVLLYLRGPQFALLLYPKMWYCFSFNTKVSQFEKLISMEAIP